MISFKGLLLYVLVTRFGRSISISEGKHRGVQDWDLLHQHRTEYFSSWSGEFEFILHGRELISDTPPTRRADPCPNQDKGHANGGN